MSLDGAEGFSGRRDLAERVALGALVEAGDPVASAIRTAVGVATQVEITDSLMQAFTTMYGTWDPPAGMTHTEFALRTALQAAGFEVLP